MGAALLVQAAAACSGGQPETQGISNFAPSNTASALTGSLAAAVLTAPTGNTVANPVIQWNALVNADGYRVWVSDTSGFRESTYFLAAGVGCGAGTGSCSVVLASTLRSGAASAWVRAENESGNGPWSLRQNFFVSSGDPAPVSPNALVIDPTPDFVWLSSGAPSYQLWINDSTGTRVNTVVTAAAAACDAAQASCTFNPNIVLVNGNARWWIRAAAGVWSAPRVFQIAAALLPARPVLVAPLAGASINDDTPSFQWNASANSTSYEIWGNTVTGVASLSTVFTAITAGCDGGGVCTFAPMTGMAVGPVRWWVRGMNQTGIGLWSVAGNFVVTGVTNPVCGNSMVEGFEGCDDGNLMDGDGCSAACTFESVCGNVTVEPGEGCDDGNEASGDGCVGCLLEGVPGDGDINAGEQCDDGNVNNGDGCSSVSLCEGGTLINFEGVGNLVPVADYYAGGAGPNLGITFSPSGLALGDSDQVAGGGNFGGEPSPDTILFFVDGDSTVMNVPAGFAGGFSVYYSAIGVPGTLRIYDDLDATGNLLETVFLPVTPSDGGDPTGAFSPFYPVGVVFPGVARSVDFGGVADQIGMDDVRLSTCD